VNVPDIKDVNRVALFFCAEFLAINDVSSLGRSSYGGLNTDACFLKLTNGMEYCHVSLIVALTTTGNLNLAVAVECNEVQLVEHVALCFLGI